MSSTESVPPATVNNSTRMIGEKRKGMPPPIKYVYKRRGKVEQKDTEKISKSPPKSVTLSATATNSKEKQASEDPFKGIPKPPVKYVFKRRDKMQQDTEE